jgi:predicted metal-dependent phosphoesterase TrpH
MRAYASDLHIHTCLSPCGDLEMAPKNIVRRAREEGLNIIGITDHNTGKNVQAVLEAAQGVPVTVMPGMEVQTIEEVHVLTFFETIDELRRWDGMVYEALPDIKNNPDYFGDQPIVNAEGEIVGFEERLLLNSLQMTLEQVFREVGNIGGYCIPAHIDKDAFGLISHLGIIPRNLNIAAVEVRDLRQAPQLADVKGLQLIASSDAHFLAEVGTRGTNLLMEEASFSEVLMALEGKEGRRVVSLW